MFSLLKCVRIMGSACAAVLARTVVTRTMVCLEANDMEGEEM